MKSAMPLGRSDWDGSRSRPCESNSDSVSVQSTAWSVPGRQKCPEPSQALRCRMLVYVYGRFVFNAMYSTFAQNNIRTFEVRVCAE